MAGKSLQPCHERTFQTPVSKMEQWKEEKWGMGGEDAPQNAAQMLNKELKDPAVYKVTTYQVSLHLQDLF